MQNIFALSLTVSWSGAGYICENSMMVDDMLAFHSLADSFSAVVGKEGKGPAS